MVSTSVGAAQDPFTTVLRNAPSVAVKPPKPAGRDRLVRARRPADPPSRRSSVDGLRRPVWLVPNQFPTRSPQCRTGSPGAPRPLSCSTTLPSVTESAYGPGEATDRPRV